MMTLRESKQAIRAFIRRHWSDQKLAEVYAFNRDGKMDSHHPCSCLLGCTDAIFLHQRRECIPRMSSHYLLAKMRTGANKAESAYFVLGYGSGPEFALIRQRRLSALLRAEIRRRDRARAGWVSDVSKSCDTLPGTHCPESGQNVAAKPSSSELELIGGLP